MFSGELFVRCWTLQAVLGEPECISVEDFLAGYHLFCRSYGIQPELFTTLLLKLEGRVFDFNGTWKLGPTVMRKWKPEVEAALKYNEPFETLETSHKSPTRDGPMDVDKGRTSQEPHREKRKRECHIPDSEDEIQTFMKRVKSDQHLMTEKDALPCMPSIYSFNIFYYGRAAFERFVAESFQQVNSLDVNVRKACCVSVKDFYKHLEEFCHRNRLSVPSKGDCGRHLSFICVKRLKHSETYAGLRWKNPSEDKKNYNFQSKTAEMRKLQMKNQEEGKIKFRPHPKYTINFNVKEEGKAKVWQSTDVCFLGHEESDAEVMNVNVHMTAKFKLGNVIDIKHVARKLDNVEVITNKKTHTLRIQIRKPQIIALLYRTGTGVVTGNVDTKTLRKGARRIARLVQKASETPVEFSSFQVFLYMAFHVFPCCIEEGSEEMLVQHLAYDFHEEEHSTDFAKPDFTTYSVHFKNRKKNEFSRVNLRTKDCVRIVANSPSYFIEVFRKFSTVLMLHYGRQRTQHEKKLRSQEVPPVGFVDIM